MYCHCLEQKSDWVVRAKSLHRKMLDPTGREVTVAEYLETLPVAGTFQLKAVARSEPDRPAEELVPRGYIRLLNGFSEAWLRRSMGAGNAGSGIAIPVSEHDSY